MRCGESCQYGSWKLVGQATSSSCVEFWLNRYQTLLTGLAALLAAWVTVTAIRHQSQTARVDGAERALNEYAVAILEVMQKYEAVPVALSHETRQDAERRFQALKDATDAPDNQNSDDRQRHRGWHQPMIAQFLNCCRFAAASRVNARVERRYSNLVWPLYAALCDGINRRKALLRNGAGVTALYGLSTINPKEVQRALSRNASPSGMRCAQQLPRAVNMTLEQR